MRYNSSSMNGFHLVSKYQPTGDQPRAIAQLVDGLRAGEREQTLLGVTGSGKTFTMANIIAQANVPTLVLAHNKTLAAQLFSEFKEFFPDNEVHYFVSYFDYYQPEAYIASSDTYIEKDSKINDEIDRLRHAATSALLTRRDVIIVASVSCIYGIGSPETYADMALKITRGERRLQDKFVRLLTDIQYKRNDVDFARGTFRVRGDVVDIFPAGQDTAVRVEFFGDEVERLTRIDALTGEIIDEPGSVTIFPSSHYATPRQRIDQAILGIEKEFDERLKWFEDHGKLLEAQRLAQRTKYDLEMLKETGFVKGIENYSRYLTDREPGEQPATLIDYFPDDWLLLVDESHMTLPQVRGMYNGDRARKEVLVEHGFRLPSALDNRPLRFDEFDQHINQAIYVSATPGAYELEHSPAPAEQLIRPTGLLDPPIEVRPTDGQVDDLMEEIRATVAKNHRVLVTTLTKRMAEDLSAYLTENGVKTAYLHSEIDTLERGDILRQLRQGDFDVLVGINLLREGLDLPEVSLVAIMDADKEGFLRSEQALIQTIGRAARHVDGRVLMYGDTVTDSMRRAIDETNRRRDIQRAYNEKHGITPQTIQKKIDDGLRSIIPQKESDKKPKLDLKKIPKEEYHSLIKDLTGQMNLASANLEFEKAAELRDVIAQIRQKNDTLRITIKGGESMATKKINETPAVEAVAPQPQQYAVYQQAYVDPNKGKAKWLTFEYALSMGSLVLAVLLVVSALTAVFGGWAGQGSAVGHGGTSWLMGLFSVSVITPATGLVATSVAAVLLSVVALVGFGRVSKTLPDREGYTKRTAYKVITYGALAALVLPALALIAKLAGILVSSLLFIGVDGAGDVYKSLYLAEFLPYLLSLGVLAMAAFFVGKIVNGRNASKTLSFIMIGVAATLLIASAITVAVQVRDTGESSRSNSDYSEILKLIR